MLFIVLRTSCRGRWSRAANIQEFIYINVLTGLFKPQFRIASMIILEIIYKNLQHILEKILFSV